MVGVMGSNRARRVLPRPSDKTGSRPSKKRHERPATEVAKEAAEGPKGPAGSQDHGAKAMWLMVATATEGRMG